MDIKDSNPFTALLKALWRRGEDGEVLARELAEALKYAMKEGKGPDCDLHAEFDRLLKG